MSRTIIKPREKRRNTPTKTKTWIRTSKIPQNCFYCTIRLKFVIVKNQKCVAKPSVTGPFYASKTLMITCNRMTELTSKCQVLFGLQVLWGRVENARSKMPACALLLAIYSLMLGFCRPEGAFISHMISSDGIYTDLISPELSAPWIDPVLRSSNPWSTGRTHTLCEVCSDWLQPQRTGSLHGPLGSDEMRSVEMRWDETR